jgi:predicted site-specific integrase-resolvase
MKYLTSQKTCEILGVLPNTLRYGASQSKIEHIVTPYGQRKYHVESFLGKNKNAIGICYCRVSSSKQRDDIQRQIEFMQSRYPTHQIIKDIVRYLNFKRKGLKSVLGRLLDFDQLELVVAHKDRLARFGFELIQYIVEQNGGEIVVLGQTVHCPKDELTQDLLTILHVFFCRMHGLRKYKNKKDQVLPEQKTEKSVETVVRYVKACLQQDN